MATGLTWILRLLVKSHPSIALMLGTVFNMLKELEKIFLLLKKVLAIVA